VFVEFKFNADPKKTPASSLDKTATGIQGSHSWIAGDLPGDKNRLVKAIPNVNLRESIEESLETGRTESWVVGTDRYGGRSVQKLDINGKPTTIQS